ncbi:MAG TPA: tetratricopeptide repeat protein [Candidatus Angelobacter sp.]|nr:tetratricopeptide repeat protein [Candidatus Angelobacter sp.]
MTQFSVFDRPISSRVLDIVLAVTMLGICCPARAGDVEDCRSAATLLQADRSKAVAPAAVTACRRLAERGTASAQYNLGNIYLSGRGVPRDYKEAVKWFRKAADHGEVDAQSNLGYMYAEGWGVPRDYKEAAKWFRKAADKGNLRAQSNLGVMYATGQGVPQDDQEALKWWRKAADQGDARAQHNVAVIYADGQGTTQDLVLAYMWFQLAAMAYPPGADRDDAVSSRNDVANEMTAAEIAKAKKLATEWKPKPAP